MAGLPVLVLVFALIIWVVLQVVRAQQNEIKNNQPPQRRNPFDANRPAGQDPNRTPERSSANDIDRFLQEIDRLRQRAAKPKEGEERPAARPQPVLQPPQSAPPQPRSRPVVQRPQPQARPQAPAKPVPAVRPESPRPPVVTAPPAPSPSPPVAPPPLPNVADQKFAEFSAPPPTSTITSSLVGAAPAVKAKAQESAVVELIRTMLKQPKGFAAALLLKEILDAPRSAKR